MKPTSNEMLSRFKVILDTFGTGQIGSVIRRCIRILLPRFTLLPVEIFPDVAFIDDDDVVTFDEQFDYLLKHNTGAEWIYALETMQPLNLWNDVPVQFLDCLVDAAEMRTNVGRNRALAKKWLPPQTPRSIGSRIALESQRAQLCDAIIQGDVPPLRLLILADSLDVPYTNDSTWTELCASVSDSVMNYTL